MGKHVIALKPPAPTAPVVKAYRRKLELEREAMRAGAVQLAAASAKGDLAAKAALAALPAKLAAWTLEIDLNHEIHDLSVQEDSAAEALWRSALLLMDPEKLIEGIGPDVCCGLCQPGGFCIITAGNPYAGGQCGHPIREKHQVFGRDETGTRRFLYAHNSQALKVFTAARKRLKDEE